MQSPSRLYRRPRIALRNVCDESVSVTTTRKRLLGLAMPTLDKLRVLALWLDVSEDWLRWGVDHEMEVLLRERRIDQHPSSTPR